MSATIPSVAILAATTGEITITIIIGGVILFALIIFFKIIRIVPQKQAYIIERLGKYSRTLEAGFHTLMPFVECLMLVKKDYLHSDLQQSINIIYLHRRHHVFVERRYQLVVRL